MSTNQCESVDCPICMEVISGFKNCVMTECGHSFHASCLMKNVAHNGFDCPYCRTVMAEEPEDSDDEEEEEGGDSDSDSDDEDYVIDYVDDEDPELYNDHSLRGMRWLFQRVNGENIEEDEDVTKPLPVYIAQKLVEQGVTIEDIVKYMLVDHPQYRYEEDYGSASLELFKKTSLIIQNFVPVPVVVNETSPLPKEHTEYIMNRFMVVS